MVNAAFWGGVFLTAISLYMLKSSIKSLRAFEESKAWPFVSGEVIESRAVRYSSTGTHTHFAVRYRYEVDGEIYTGDRSALYTHTNVEVQELVKRFPVGSKVPVYYRPEAPSESLLIVGGRDSKKYGEVIASFCALLVGVAVIVAGYLGYMGS